MRASPELYRITGSAAPGEGMQGTPIARNSPPAKVECDVRTREHTNPASPRSRRTGGTKPHPMASARTRKAREAAIPLVCGASRSGLARTASERFDSARRRGVELPSSQFQSCRRRAPCTSTGEGSVLGSKPARRVPATQEIAFPTAAVPDRCVQQARSILPGLRASPRRCCPPCPLATLSRSGNRGRFPWREPPPTEPCCSRPAGFQRSRTKRRSSGLGSHACTRAQA